MLTHLVKPKTVLKYFNHLTIPIHMNYQEHNEKVPNFHFV